MRMHILFIPPMGKPMHVYDVGSRPVRCRRTGGESPMYLEDYLEDGEVVVCEIEEHGQRGYRLSDGADGRE